MPGLNRPIQEHLLHRHADDVRRIFGAGTRAVLPSVSREVLRHGPDPAGLRGAVARLSDEFRFLRK